MYVRQKRKAAIFSYIIDRPDHASVQQSTRGCEFYVNMKGKSNLDLRIYANIRILGESTYSGAYANILNNIPYIFII